jgi:hypothetical protein
VTLSAADVVGILVGLALFAHRCRTLRARAKLQRLMYREESR